MARRQASHDVKAEHLRRRLIESSCFRDAPVGLGEVGRRHADALIDDGDEVALGPALADDGHSRGRRGERRRVLEHLGQQVRQVGGRVAADRGFFHVREIDTLVGLDLRQGRAHDVAHRHGLRPRTGRFGARQHEQALGVTPHAGGEVVEAEEVVEGVGVAFVLLELCDEGELAGQQALVTSAEVHEHLGHVAAHHGLLDREVEGRRLHGGHGVGQVGDLVARVDGDGRRRRARTFLRGGDGVGKPVLGDRVRLRGEAAQRARDGPDDHDPHEEAEAGQADDGDQQQQGAVVDVAVGLDFCDGLFVVGQLDDLVDRHAMVAIQAGERTDRDALGLVTVAGLDRRDERAGHETEERVGRPVGGVVERRRQRAWGQGRDPILVASLELLLELE